MVVYVTYDRYENDEFYVLYQVTTSYSEVLKDYKKNLFDFISFGPDDCHGFYVQKVDMSESDYEKLMELSTDPDIDEYDQELIDFMIPICDSCDINGPECLIYTDGCSDNVELVNYYCDENGLDPDTDSDDVWDLFSTNEKVYSKTLKKYINQFYSI